MGHKRKPKPLDPAIYTDPEAAAAFVRKRMRKVRFSEALIPRPVQEPHPAHGDPEALPRDAGGHIPAYYYHSPEEIARYGLTPPDPAALRRARRDGITLERQIAFITALAETASVSAAAASAGVSRKSLYALRNATHAHAFRTAWDEALRAGVRVLADVAFERAVDGVREPVFNKDGEIGYRTRYNDRLLMFLLRVRDPGNFAPLRELGDWSQIRPIEGTAGLDSAIAGLAEADPGEAVVLAGDGRAEGGALPGAGQMEDGALPDRALADPALLGAALPDAPLPDHALSGGGALSGAIPLGAALPVGAPLDATPRDAALPDTAPPEPTAGDAALVLPLLPSAAMEDAR